jgi:uncharacterized delta-60 repeat protein
MHRLSFTALVAVVSLMACPPVTTESDAGEQLDAGSMGTVDAGPKDLDVAVVRLNPDGTLDSTFGTAGIAKLDLGAATGSARDSVYGFDFDSAGRLVLFGSTKATGRSDVDRFVARLTPTGSLDSAFASEGLFRLDVVGTNDSPRHGFVQADGKIVTSGYTPFPTGVALADGGVQTSNQIVLLRLDSTGARDTTFGTDGVVSTPHFVPTTPNTLWGMAESYAVVPQSNGSYVTAGYGRTAPSGTVDLVSFRYTNTGAQDATWGDTGTLKLDLIGGDERGRHAVTLADDRVVLLGSATPLAAGNVDAMVSIATSNGALDTSFDADGVKTWSFGRNDEAFFSGAVGPGGLQLAAAGYRVGAANTADENDDAVLLVLPLSTGAPAEFAQAVPLSTSAHDRFFGVAWAGNKIVAAGFVREGADTQMAVARFNADGSRDTTFGTDGLVRVNVAAGAGTEETARWVKVQADGKIVIAGVAEH